MQPSIDRLALLYRISQTFNSSLDLDHVLNHVMDEVIAVTRAERGFLMLCDAQGELTFRVARGMDRQTIDAPEFHVSRGVIERVAREGQPLLASNAQNDEWLKGRSSVIDLGLRSILCVPLQFKQAVCGVIYVDNRLQTGIFTRNDLELLAAIANQAVVAIENASLFSDVQDKLQTLHLLHQISADLTSTLDLDQVLTACLQRVLDLFAATTASILTLEGDELVFQIALGEKAEEVKPFRLSLGQGIAGWVVQNAQGMYSNNVRNDPRFFAGVDSETGFVTQSLMAAPLIVNERAIGVIEVCNKPGDFSAADLDMLGTIASSAAIAIDNARLYQVAIEKGRMERELQVAHEVQSSLLPRQTPEIPDWDLAACWQPAREVSGDFYDFIPLDSNLAKVSEPSQEPVLRSLKGLGIVIADVADKGMLAALFMTLTRSIVRASVVRASPADGIAQANRLICADASNGMFVSLFYAQLNPITSEIVYVNAGHNLPLLYRTDQDQLTALERTGMVLGVDHTAQFEQRTLQLYPGDFVLLYTDGILDATDAQGEEFGVERLHQLVLKKRGASATRIVTALKKALGDFVGGAAPFDDITIVAIKRL